MATNKKSVKIQDIIDEVNSVWGEKHEEQRKEIFLNNIIKLPLYAFLPFRYCIFLLLLSLFHL